MHLWTEPILPGGMEFLRASCVDHRYPAHFHDEFVIAAFQGGAQRHRIARHWGVARAGSLMFIPPGEVHTGEAAERGGGWNYCALYPTAAVLDMLADDMLCKGGVFDFGLNSLVHDPVLSRVIAGSLTTIAQSRDPVQKHCIAFDVLGSVIERYGRRSGVGLNPRQLTVPIRSACDFIEDCHHQALKVSDIAATVGLSEFYFMRTFRCQTGLSVHQFLTQVRLRRAKRYLAEGLSAAEVASAVGLFDQSHLVKLFRLHFGVTPGAFIAASRPSGIRAGARKRQEGAWVFGTRGGADEGVKWLGHGRVSIAVEAVARPDRSACGRPLHPRSGRERHG